jgi:hypothetical protein
MYLTESEIRDLAFPSLKTIGIRLALGFVIGSFSGATLSVLVILMSR